MNADTHTLVLLRHSHSDWNLSNRFTGWTDIHLTDKGLQEAAHVGRILAANGFQFDEVHVSVLQRTRQTADALLEAAGHRTIPCFSSWRLNERHYGQLQGLDKQAIFNYWGEVQSRRWWRGYYEPPPGLDADDPRHPRFDALYQELRSDVLPCAESLQQCQNRLLPYWHGVLDPKIRKGSRLLVISHGNTLRCLRMYLDGLDAEAVEKLEIPPAVPLIYRFNEAMNVVGIETLWPDGEA